MPLPANETHKYLNRTMARKAAEKAKIDDIDLHFYVAKREDGKTMWGWCSQDLAEISGAADATPDNASSEAATVAVAEGPACSECGEDAFVTDDGVSHHSGDGMDGVDHDADADHVALVEDFARPTVHTLAGHAEPMVILQIEGILTPAQAAILAQVYAIQSGDAITVLDAVTFEPGQTIARPAAEFFYTDEKGRQHTPTVAQAAFIALCMKGATSAELKTGIVDTGLKANCIWSQMGEDVEKFGLEYSLDYRRVSKTKLEPVHRLVCPTVTSTTEIA